MTRTKLSDGRFFDRDAAKRWEEDTFFDGRNRISRATGDQWLHEALYRTAGGKWILCSWSDWQGSGPALYDEVDNRTAARWLIANEYEPHDACASEFAALEVR